MAIRQDVATLGPGWHPILEWYAKAINTLQALGPDERTSWVYLSGIHGFDNQTSLDRGVITAASSLPSQADQDRMWNQCQHQGWYFIPWHRGYLWAFEQIIIETIRSLEGPADDWALPYWNYLDDNNPAARDLPWAFLEPTLSDGVTTNPLSQTPRFQTSLQPFGPIGDISLSAMSDDRFTAAPGTLGFGGGQTVFSHFGGLTGDLEQDPHNTVHVMLGGLDDPVGFMSDPNLAALDPIFWLHHCNIDRLFEAWFAQPNTIMEGSAPWRDGPSPDAFEMPDPQGNIVSFTPDETLLGGSLAPTYDDLSAGTGLGAGPAAVGEEGGAAVPRFSSEPPPKPNLVGATSQPLTVTDAPATAEVKFAESALEPAGAEDQQRIFLNLENVRGSAPSAVLSIRLSAPGGALPAAAEAPIIKSVSLFGLAKASKEGDRHGGEGITVAIDITEEAKRIAQESGAPLDQLTVAVEQPGGARRAGVTVGKISIYSLPGE